MSDTATAAGSAKQRVQEELSDFISKLDKLEQFLENINAGKFFIPTKQVKLLYIQRDIMSAYVRILQTRLGEWEFEL